MEKSPLYSVLILFSGKGGITEAAFHRNLTEKSRQLAGVPCTRDWDEYHFGIG
jgi:hypothetical protein